MDCTDRFRISSTLDINKSYDTEIECLDFSINNYEAMLLNDLDKDKYNLTRIFKNTIAMIHDKRIILCNSLVNIREISDVIGLSEKLVKIKEKLEILFNKKNRLYSDSSGEDPYEIKLIQHKKMIDEEIVCQLKILEDHKIKLLNY